MVLVKRGEKYGLLWRGALVCKPTLSFEMARVLSRYLTGRA